MNFQPLIPMRSILLRLFSLTAFTALPAAAQSRPPIQKLGAVQASSRDTLGIVTNIRALPGGRLLVNDVSSRRVLLLDSAFNTIKVVADSTSSTARAYGPRSGALIAYRGDSTLFVDAAALSMLVLDGNGEIVRVMSVPRSQDAPMLAAANLGTGAFYSNGYLVYRSMPNTTSLMRDAVLGSAGPRGMTMPQPPSVADSIAIVRVSVETRAVDTVGVVRLPPTRTNMVRSDDGNLQITIQVNPLPTVDEWAVTSDGHIALIRGRDYHVDWMLADGTRASTPKMPFDWKRLSDEDKVALMDSVKVLRAKTDSANAMAGGAGGSGAAAPTVIGTERFAVGVGAASTGLPQITTKVDYVSPGELPDYQPPFFATSSRADQDGNIWIQTIQTRPQPAGGPVYDVINANGEVTSRVQIPEGRTIVGFGGRGVVYLARRTGMHTIIERASAH